LKKASNRYSLNIVKNDGSVIMLAKETLFFIDSVTSEFVDKKELLNEINKIFDMKLDLEKARVEITYNHDKHNRTARVLYFKDKEAMNREKIAEMFLSHTQEIRFVEKFVIM
jgi:hypothetical protein